MSDIPDNVILGRETAEQLYLFCDQNEPAIWTYDGETMTSMATALRKALFIDGDMDEYRDLVTERDSLKAELERVTNSGISVALQASDLGLQVIKLEAELDRLRNPTEAITGITVDADDLRLVVLMAEYSREGFGSNITEALDRIAGLLSKGSE